MRQGMFTGSQGVQAIEVMHHGGQVRSGMLILLFSTAQPHPGPTSQDDEDA
jgi:hypothetical protein